jgi:hypothetical protein
MSERLQAEGRNIDQYITEMSKSSTWIDDLALHAASVLYDCVICILREDSEDAPPVRIGSSTCNQSIFIGYVSCQPREQPSHYVSLLPVTGLFWSCL